MKIKLSELKKIIREESRSHESLDFSIAMGDYASDNEMSTVPWEQVELETGYSRERIERYIDSLGDWHDFAMTVYADDEGLHIGDFQDV